MNTQKALVIDQEASFLESREGLKEFNEALAPFKNIEPSIIGLTSTGKIVYVNCSACDLLGYAQEELEGLPIGALSPEMTAPLWSRFWIGLGHEGPKLGETRLHLSEKKKIAVEFRPLFFHRSGLKYCIMTEPGKIPAAGVKGEIHIRPWVQVLNHMADPAVIRDEQHKQICMNHAACRWLGTTPEEAAGTTVFDYLPKSYADIAWKEEQNALDGGRASTHACHGFLRAKYHESVTLLPFLDPGTSQKRLLVIANKPPHTTRALPMDMPESHELAPAKPKPGYLTRVGQILEREAPLGIYYKNRDNRILWVNQAFARMTGLEIRDFVGMRVDDLISDPEILAIFREDDNYVYATGKPFLNRMIPRFNNQPGYYRLDKLPFINRNGELVGIIGLTAEVDGPDPRPHELKNQHASMSRKLQESENALRAFLDRRGQDVYQARKELRSKVKDLVAPYLEQLKQTRLTPEQVEFVDLIETNLKNFYDPTHVRLASPSCKLSPTELKVAQFVRDGKTNKEIARLLHLSKSTILTHRHHVRAKLGIKNKKVNLRGLLNS
jgi:PAS domain-containing protein/DNA-binding CsgD family transcriptional regulator